MIKLILTNSTSYRTKDLAEATCLYLDKLQRVVEESGGELFFGSSATRVIITETHDPSATRVNWARLVGVGEVIVKAPAALGLSAVELLLLLSGDTQLPSGMCSDIFFCMVAAIGLQQRRRVVLAEEKPIRYSDLLNLGAGPYRAPKVKQLFGASFDGCRIRVDPERMAETRGVETVVLGMPTLFSKEPGYYVIDNSDGKRWTISGKTMAGKKSSV